MRFSRVSYASPYVASSPGEQSINETPFEKGSVKCVSLARISLTGLHKGDWSRPHPQPPPYSLDQFNEYARDPIQTCTQAWRIAVGATTGLTGSGPAEPRAVASDTTVGTLAPLPKMRPNEASSTRIEIPRHDRQVLLRFQAGLAEGPDAARGYAQCCCHSARRCWLRPGQHIWWVRSRLPNYPGNAPSDKILKSLNISAPDTLGGIDHLDPTDRFQLN